MIEKTFCPFTNAHCRDDCVFKYHNVGTINGVSNCLISVKLMDINADQQDQLSEIARIK